MAKPSCKIEVERPLPGGPYHDLTFDVRCKVDGVQAGKLLAWKQEESGQQVMAVSNVVVEKRFMRQGLGTQMYQAAAEAACESFGLPLASDKNNQRSKYAEGFWKKQAKKKRATCIGDSGGKKCRRWVLSCPAPVSLEGMRRRRR